MAEEAEKKGTKRLGGYELISQLGRGGMGAVYKARQTSLDRLVALKILTPSLAKNKEFIKRFLREARAAGKLNHPNIVTGIDVGEVDGYFFFAMEFVDGESLGGRIKREGSVPVAEAVSIIRQVAEGLKHAHDHDMIHRDVKPDNVMVDSRGTAKLCDLGLARASGGEEASLTQTGTALGTPHYISPEQARGEQDVDGRVDVYSLGATLYHLITGITPYSGTTAAVVLTKHINEPVPDPLEIVPEAGQGVAAVIAKCMAKDRADRYQDMTELAADLDLLIAGKLPKAVLARTHRTRTRGGSTGTRTTAPVEPVTGRRHAVRRRTETALSSRPWHLMAAGLALMLITAAGAWAVVRPSDEKKPVRTEPIEPEVPEPPPVETPEPPPVVERPDFEKMLSEAELYLKDHPADYEGAIARFAKVRKAAEGTKHWIQADRRIGHLTAERDAAAETAFRKLKATSDGLAARSDYDAALAAWLKLPPALDKHLRPKADAEMSALRGRAMKQLDGIYKRAEARLAAGKPAEGLAELAAADPVRYAPWTRKIASMRSRLEEARKNAAELDRQQKLALARRDLEKYLNDFDAKAAKGDYAGARAVSEKAQMDTALKKFAVELDALKKVAAGLGKITESRKKVFDALVGQRLTFQLGKEKIRGEVTAAGPEEIAVSVTERLGAQKIVFPKKIKPSQLTGPMREKLRGEFKPASPDDFLAQAIHAYVLLDRATMESGMAGAKGQPLAPRWQKHLEVLRLGAVEAAAKLAWEELKARPEAQPGFKLTEKVAQGLLGRISTYEGKHGTTKHAADTKAEREGLKDRARGVLVTWVKVPAWALQPLVKDGARAGFDKASGAMTVTVPKGGKAMVPMAVNTRDFRLRFEYRGPGIEMFLRKRSGLWKGCSLVWIGKDKTSVRYYPTEEDGRNARDVTVAGNRVGADTWHRVSVVMKGSDFEIKVDEKTVGRGQGVPATARGNAYVLVWDTGGGAVQFRNVEMAIGEKDTATAPEGGITTGLLGGVEKRGGTAFDLQGDADRRYHRYTPFPTRAGPNPLTVQLLKGDDARMNFFSANRATVIWRSYRGGRRIIAAWMEIPNPGKGTVSGEVANVEVVAGGRWAIFDFKPDGGAPLQRYAPRWQDQKILDAIKALKAGDRVKINWTYEHRRRALTIEKIK